MGPFDDRWNFDLTYLDIFPVGGCRILWIYMLRYTFKGHEFGLSNVSNNEKKSIDNLNDDVCIELKNQICMLFDIHVHVSVCMTIFFRPQKASSLQEAVVNHVDGHATSVSKPAPLNQVKAVSKYSYYIGKS